MGGALQGTGMVRSLVCILVLLTSTAVLFPVALLAMALTRKAGASMWVARRLWAPLLLRAAGVRLLVEGREHVDPRRPTVYVANHQSALDIPAHLVAVPVNFRFVAKQELRWVPLLGWYLVIADHILINRRNHDAAVASLRRAARKVRAGTSIFLYPEGTRSRDGRILPFKKGPFALALEARVPICPITIEGSARVMPRGSWRLRPGPVYVRIGRPIDTWAYGAQERERLAREVRAVILEQSLELGGRGGTPGAAVARPGFEGVSPPSPPA